MPKVTEAHVEARRQQIIEAAARCFSRQGFHKTTMQDICTESVLSPGAIYRYFPSKEEIIEAMAEESLRRNVALIQEIKERGDTQEVLDQLSDTFFGPLDCADCEGDIRCDVELWGEALREPRILDICRRAERSHSELFAEIVREGQAKGEISAELDAEAVARVMISFYQGLVVQKAIDPSADVGKYVQAMKAMMSGRFWKGVRPGGVAASRKE